VRNGSIGADSPISESKGELGLRWRVSQAVSKTGRARWVQVPPVAFEAVVALDHAQMVQTPVQTSESKKLD
jgi:hypothetical protein